MSSRNFAPALGLSRGMGNIRVPKATGADCGARSRLSRLALGRDDNVSRGRRFGRAGMCFSNPPPLALPVGVAQAALEDLP